jgi:hypothetical protein
VSVRRPPDSVDGKLNCRTPVKLIDLSEGGACVETTECLKLHKKYIVDTAYNGVNLRRKGKIVCAILIGCERRGSEDFALVYRAGVRFEGTITKC